MRRSVAAIVMLGWSACAPPAEQRESCSDAACTTGASECAEDGTLVVCTPDEDGCGSYPSSGHACLEGACIERDDDTAYCPCTDDPGCSAAWSACDDDGAIFGCAANEEGCIKPMRTTCAPPLVCVNPPSAQSSCGCPPATLAGFGVPLPVQRGGGCPMLGALGCDVLTSAMDECVTDAGCQIWREKMRCEEVGLRCSGSAGSGAFCQCPNTNGPSFYVDAAAGSTNNPDQTKFSATGAESPAKCRFKTIAAAMLAASNARAKFKDISVIATGAGVAPMTFGAATTGESGFFIYGGITLTTDEPAGTAPGKYVLAPSSSLTLDMGATLRQFAVVFDANTPSYFRGITSLCNVTGIIPPPVFTLDNVVIDGSNRVDHAIAADASCGAVIKDSVVRNFLGWGMAQTAFVASTVVRTRISGGTRGIFHQLSGLQLEDVTITGASEAGLYVIGGSTSCSPCVLSANGVGLDQRGGVVSFAGGSAITDNTGAGIALAGGTLAIGGSGPSGVEIAGNGAEGIIVGTSPSSVPYNASSLTLAGANVHDNVGPGLRVQNPFGPSGSPGVVGVSGCTFTNNGGANLRVDDSGVRVGADPISLRVNATTFIGSAHAVWLAGTTSSAVALSGSTLRDATDTAMLIEHLSPAWHVRLTGNELRHNAATTPRAGQLIGGFFAHSDAGWPADFVFEGNSLFSNTQHQMGLDVAGVTGPTSVSISFGALGCAGPANSFYCYANAPALSAAKGLVVSAGSNVTLSVDAGAANWQNGLSTAGLDDQLISAGACAVTGSACGGFAPMCPN